jgi:hypothetical protein
MTFQIRAEPVPEQGKEATDYAGMRGGREDSNDEMGIVSADVSAPELGYAASVVTSTFFSSSRNIATRGGVKLRRLRYTKKCLLIVSSFT